MNVIKKNVFSSEFFGRMFRIKSLLVILLICLFFGPHNLCAQDNSRDLSDLTPDEIVALRHDAQALQTIIDADRKAALDRAEEKWQREHASHNDGDIGSIIGSIFGTLLCLGTPCLIIWSGLKRPESD